jgi:hypothetical protein
MTTNEFLTANREEVISYYNNEIAAYWTITLKDFMTDLMNNFRKITISEEYKRFDLMGNLQDAKERLGVFNKITVVAEDKKTDALRNRYNGTAYMAMV